MIKRAFSKVRYEMGCCPLFKGNGCPFRVVTRSRQTMQTASHSSATAAGHRAASCIGLPSGHRPFM